MLIRIGDRPPSKLHAAIYLNGNKVAETAKIDTPFGLTTYELPFPSGVILDANVDYIFAFRGDVDTEYDVEYSGSGPGAWAYPYYEFPDSITWTTSENTIYFCVYAEVKPFEPLGASLTIAVYPDYADLSGRLESRPAAFSDLASQLMIPFTAISEITARLRVPKVYETDFPAQFRIKALGEEELSSQTSIRLYRTISLTSELSIPYKKFLKGLLEVTGVSTLKGMINIKLLEGAVDIDFLKKMGWIKRVFSYPTIILISKKPYIEMKRGLLR